MPSLWRVVLRGSVNANISSSLVASHHHGRLKSSTTLALSFCKPRSKVTALYNGPFPRLRSLLCLAQRSFPLCVGVVPNALLRKDCVSDFELSIRFAIEAGCVPGAIKLLHRGLADRPKEGPGQRSILY